MTACALLLLDSLSKLEYTFWCCIINAHLVLSLLEKIMIIIARVVINDNV